MAADAFDWCKRSVALQTVSTGASGGQGACAPCADGCAIAVPLAVPSPSRRYAATSSRRLCCAAVARRASRKTSIRARRG